MAAIQRLGDSGRWSDVVIYRDVARWVEVAADLSADATGQIEQIFGQIDETLLQICSSREDLLEITIYLSSLDDVSALNAAWDAWVPRGHAPIRACVQAGLQGNCRAEFIISAAVQSDS